MRWATLDDGASRSITLTTGVNSSDVLTDVTGWYGGAGLRTERIDRLGDGAFPSPTVREGRKLTLTGVAQRATPAQIEQFVRELSGMFPSGTTKGHLEVGHENGDALTAVGVEPDGPPRITTSFDYGWCRFEIPLYVPDPYLYGDPAQTVAFTATLGSGLEYPEFDNADGVTTGVLEFGSSMPEPVPVVNTGNAVAYPVIEVAGDFRSGFTLALAGDRAGGGSWGVTYSADVRPGAPVVVDMGGRVLVGGRDQSWALTRRDWGGVRPGGAVSVSIAPNSGGDGTARLMLRPTWM